MQLVHVGFEIAGGDKPGARVGFAYDMLHVTPPQGTPDLLKGSPVANAAGFVDVNANSLQHVKYPEIFGLGDAGELRQAAVALASLPTRSKFCKRGCWRVQAVDADLEWLHTL